MKNTKLNKKSFLKFMLPVLGLGVLATAVALPITSCSEATGVTLAVQSGGNDIGSNAQTQGSQVTVKVTFSEKVKSAKVTATLSGLQSDGSTTVTIEPATWNLTLTLDPTGKIGTADYTIPTASNLKSISVTGIKVVFTPDGGSETTANINDLTIKVA